MTPPTPPITPVVIRSRRSPSGMACLTHVAKTAVWSSIQFIGGSASVKMLMKSRVMTAPSTVQPHTEWVTTVSILSESVGPVSPV